MKLFTDERTAYGPVPNLKVVITYAPTVACTCDLKPADETYEPFLVQTGHYAGADLDHPPYGALYGDPEALRDALDDVTTPEEAQQFLSKCGPWLCPKTNIEHAEDEDGRTDVQTMFWSGFQRWQQYFRDRRLDRSTNDYPPGSSPLLFRGRPSPKLFAQAAVRRFGIGGDDGIHLWMDARCAVEAIAAIIETDLLREIKYRECANDSCRRGRGGRRAIFRVGYRDEKVCCGDACTHVVGQRVRRRAERLKRIAAKTELSKNHAKGLKPSLKRRPSPPAPADPVQGQQPRPQAP